MHVLFGADEPNSGIRERWEKLGIRSTLLPPTRVLEPLKELVVDGIVLLSEPIVSGRGTGATSTTPIVSNLPTRIRALPEWIAMPDGRRWSALPIVVLAEPPDFGHLAAFAAHLKDVGYRAITVHEISATDDYGARLIKQAVKEYRQHVLDELDSLGFIVAYDAGRYRVGPALKPRPELVGEYYFGPADQRLSHFVTVDRDFIGVQLEVELLEALLNNEQAAEVDYQRFFEEYPHFLSASATPLPHVQLRDASGKLLVPDFILKPVVAAQRDSRWEVLDLKRPDVSLISGKGSRKRLSQSVQEAIRQLRDYGDYFADPRNTRVVERTLGQRLRRPKLGVLIGRLFNVDVEAFELEQSRLADIKIITYDEILEQQRVLLS
jgi:hypothetical protein